MSTPAEQIEGDFFPADLASLVPKDDDRGVVAEFYISSVHMGFKSREAGYPIHEDREFVRIMVKGNDKMRVEREATDQDRRRFAHQYQAFKAGESQLKEGTPLSYLPGITPATQERLATLGIRTVQDLAEVGDNVLDNIGHGGRTLRDRARAFVGDEPVEVTDLRKELEVKEGQICELTARLERLESMLTSSKPHQEDPPAKPRRRSRAK